MSTSTRDVVDFPDLATALSQLPATTMMELLQHRPDALSPSPRDFGELARRLQAPHSVFRAMRHVDLFALGILGIVLRAQGHIQPVSAPKVVETLGHHLTTVSAHNDAVGVGSPDAAVRTAGDAVGNDAPQDSTSADPTALDLPALVSQAGNFLASLGLLIIHEHQGTSYWLAPSCLPDVLPWQGQALFAGPELAEIQALLADCSPVQREILDKLLKHTRGRSQDAHPDTDPSKPIPQLLNAGLLERLSDQEVRLPRLVYYQLVRQDLPALPDVMALLSPIAQAYSRGQRPQVPSEFPADAIDVGKDHALTQGLELVRLVRALVEHIQTNPVKLLINGSLGVRPLKQLAQHLHEDELVTSRIIAVAVASQLIAPGSPHPAPPEDEDFDFLTCTLAAELWLDLPLAHQWAWLLQEYWQRGCMVPIADPRSDQRLFDVSSWNAARPALRRELGMCWWFVHDLQLPVTTSSQAQFWAPHFGFSDPTEVSQFADEAQWLGLCTPQGKPTAVLAALLVDAQTTAPLAKVDDLPLLPMIAQVTAALTPPATTMLIAQGDMTLLAPGPLTPEASRLLYQFAEVESPGVATVFRVSEASVRSGIARGGHAPEFLAFLEKACPTELPQPLRYAISDAARDDATATIGAALSYVRSSDPATISALLHHQVAEATGLRQIAPEVLIAQVPVHRLRAQLVAAGFRFHLEDEQGARVALAQQYVLGSLKDQSSLWPARYPQDADSGELSGLVAALQQNEPTGTQNVQDILAILRQAISQGQQVLIGWVNATGTELWSEVTPIAVAQGRLSAMVTSQAAPQSFELHRLTSAKLLEK